jgi:hypothetical protein
MSDKRYQVFLSSTYRDLAEERQHVMQTIMQMDGIPAGMELFPAADEEQFQFIKRVIDDCDYYLLILGGRYGSLAPDGSSYTEKEYDYAVERGVKVIAFVHADPGAIASAKTDTDPEIVAKLALFRQKVTTGRLVKEWRTASDLPGLVALSLSMTMKMFPAAGWVRGGATGNPELLAEVVKLTRENDDLKAKLQAASLGGVTIANLAGGHEQVQLKGSSWKVSSNAGTWRQWETRMSWDAVFWIIAPHLLIPFADVTVKAKISEMAAAQAGPSGQGQQPTLDDNIFQTIKVQMMALGLVNVESMKTEDNKLGLFWTLTAAGKEKLLRIRSVRAAAATELPGTLPPQTPVSQ